MENNILDTIQTISYIFYRKNIFVCPYDVTYRNTIIKPENELIVLNELMIYLAELLITYKSEHKVEHKFHHYLKSFITAFNDNFDNGILVAQKKRKIA